MPDETSDMRNLAVRHKGTSGSRVRRIAGADQVSTKGAMEAARVLITAADRCPHPSPVRYCRRGDHTSRAGAELVSNQQTRLVHRPLREGMTVTPRQLELLQPARSQPYLLDDATVAPIIGVHRDQAGDLDLFQNQADRWKASPDLTEA